MNYKENKMNEATTTVIFVLIFITVFVIGIIFALRSKEPKQTKCLLCEAPSKEADFLCVDCYEKMMALQKELPEPCLNNYDELYGFYEILKKKTKEDLSLHELETICYKLLAVSDLLNTKYRERDILPKTNSFIEETLQNFKFKWEH